MLSPLEPRSARFALALLATALPACTDDRPEAAARGPARRIVVVTCDTLRADHLGCYGYSRPTSPRLDAFARESILFEAAFSAAPLTNPSLSSLMAGRMPGEIGATPSNEDLMSSEILTLAEVARANGLDTAAFVANVVLVRPPADQGDIGLPQGFDHYDDRMGAWSEGHTIPDRSARELTDAVVAWLDARTKREDRFFLWVHYMDPHGPYTPPEEHLAPFARDHAGEADLPLSSTHSGRGGIPDYQQIAGRRKPGEYVDRYDGEIHAFDAQFGRLVDALAARDWLDDTLVVFTADHGESLGEHDDWFCHGETIHRELVRVPLVVRPPRALRERRDTADGQRVLRLAMHLDVWPTVLEAGGLEGPTYRGVSLLGARLPTERIAVHSLGRIVHERHFVGWTDGRWHLMTDGFGIPRLYDMVADPGETNDVAQVNPTLVARLQEQYEAFRANLDLTTMGTKRRVDEANRRGLEAMGYTGDGR